MIATTVKERGILMRAPMVLSIRAGNKSQTRRTVTPQPVLSPGGTLIDPHWGAKPFGGLILPKINDLLMYCPYGRDGDRLWVRETWQAWAEFDSSPIDDISPDARKRLNYLADGNKWKSRVRSSLHMPRWASRLTLEITSRRIEQKQDISDADCIAEGIERISQVGFLRAAGWKDYLGGPGFFSPRESYASLTDSINGKGTWDKNEWNWVIEFRVVTGGAK